MAGFSSSGGGPSAVESSACCSPLRDVLLQRALSLGTKTSLSFDMTRLDTVLCKHRAAECNLRCQVAQGNLPLPQQTPRAAAAGQLHFAAPPCLTALFSNVQPYSSVHDRKALGLGRGPVVLGRRPRRERRPGARARELGL